MISAETYNHDYEVAYKYGYKQGIADGKKEVLDEFANWYRLKGYSAYDIGLLIREYKKEQK